MPSPAALLSSPSSSPAILHPYRRTNGRTPTPHPRLRVPPPPSRRPLSLTVRRPAFTSASLSPAAIAYSTRTVTSLLSAALALTRAAGSRLPHALSEAAALRRPPSELARAAGPLFFAAIRAQPSGYLNTPLTVVAAGMARWLDIYRHVIMLRILLSWFPNIPWSRQPLSAVRDLCDPYLNLFRNIIPPVFDGIDVSTVPALAVLGAFASILDSAVREY